MGQAAEQDIVPLVHRLFLHLDERRYGALADLFAPDGTWQRQGRLLRGRDAIVAALEERSPTLTTFHMITNAFADASGPDTAEAHAVMIAYRHDDGTTGEGVPTVSGPASMARLRARMRRLPEGWRIEAMTSQPLFHLAAPLPAAA